MYFSKTTKSLSVYLVITRNRNKPKFLITDRNIHTLTVSGPTATVKPALMDDEH
jgi:hypothetical protein